MALGCKCCGKKFCAKCITLEVHNCDGIEDDINNKKKLLTDTLNEAVYEKKGKFGLE
jgi:hypothetical protein